MHIQVESIGLLTWYASLVASIQIYFCGERRRDRRPWSVEARSAVPEHPREGVRGGCALPSVEVAGQWPPEDFWNCTCKSVHFGAFWRRLSNFRWKMVGTIRPSLSGPRDRRQMPGFRPGFEARTDKSPFQTCTETFLQVSRCDKQQDKSVTDKFQYLPAHSPFENLFKTWFWAT